MRKSCPGCGQKIDWRLEGTSPDIFEPETETPHVPHCPSPEVFFLQTVINKEGERVPYEGPPKRLSMWSFLTNYWDQIELQRESFLKDAEASGVSGCRDAGRDAQHGDHWCRTCYIARPPGHDCSIAVYASGRYVKQGGEVSLLKGNDLKDYMRAHGIDLEENV